MRLCSSDAILMRNNMEKRRFCFGKATQYYRIYQYGRAGKVLEFACGTQNNSLLGSNCKLGICCSSTPFSTLLLFYLFHHSYSCLLLYLLLLLFCLKMQKAIVDMDKPPEMISKRMTGGKIQSFNNNKI